MSLADDVLHDVLEHAAFAAWRDWRTGEDAPAGERAKIAEALSKARG